jgi:hypothetical protein
LDRHKTIKVIGFFLLEFMDITDFYTLPGATFAFIV